MQPVPARSPQILEFMFGEPYRVHRLKREIVEDACAIALVGAQTFRRVELLMRGRVDAFTIAFQPGGLMALFSIPPVELTNADYDGGEMLGRASHELYDRLSEGPSFADRVRTADDYFLSKHPGQTHSNIVRVASRINAMDGSVRVRELADDTGLGVRQFERRFRDEIGIAPKLYAKIVRFEAALRRKEASHQATWTDIAHALGYHDQMHMVHDFKQLAGESPSGICDQLDMFVLPEVVCGAPQSL